VASLIPNEKPNCYGPSEKLLLIIDHLFHLGSLLPHSLEGNMVNIDDNIVHF